MERPKFNESAPMDTLEQFSTNEQVIGDISKAEYNEKMKIVRWEIMKGATIGFFTGTPLGFMFARSSYVTKTLALPRGTPGVLLKSILYFGCSFAYLYGSVAGMIAMADVGLTLPKSEKVQQSSYLPQDLPSNDSRSYQAVIATNEKQLLLSSDSSFEKRAKAIREAKAKERDDF
jgi:hypothetical protein